MYCIAFAVLNEFTRSKIIPCHTILAHQFVSIKYGCADRCARKTFLHLLSRNCHLRGISGPGAPHVFAFDRRADLIDQGRLRDVLHSTSFVNCQFFFSKSVSEQKQIQFLDVKSNRQVSTSPIVKVGFGESLVWRLRGMMSS